MTRRAVEMLIESLGIFGVISLLVTVVRVYRTPVVRDVGPFNRRPRHVERLLAAGGVTRGKSGPVRH